MKVNLRQTGGIAGLDDELELDEHDLTVSRSGERQTRRLTKAERARVAEAARRLLKQSAPVGPKPEYTVSDSMLTTIEVGDKRKQRQFEVESGQDAPDELWDLVDAMSEVARPT
jgi:hypothetical protein